MKPIKNRHSRGIRRILSGLTVLVAAFFALNLIIQAEMDIWPAQILNQKSQPTGSIIRNIHDTKTLQDAVDTAKPGDILIISQDIALTSSIEVMGKQITLRGEKTGEGRYPILSLESAHTDRHLYAYGADSGPCDVTLEDLTFSGHHDQNRYGGGIEIRNYLGSNVVGQNQLHINRCTITGNRYSMGGGLLALEGTVNLTDSNVIHNIAARYDGEGYGGGMNAWVEKSIFNIRNSNISHNRAEGDGGYGGGLYLSSHSQTTISDNSTINENEAGSNGGGIHAYVYAQVDITNSQVNHNKANYAAGIYCSYKSTVNIRENTSVDYNISSAGAAGGILCTGDSTLNMSGGSVSFNTATNSGGGIYGSDNSSINITGGSILGNSTLGHGGGVYAAKNLDIRNAVIGTAEHGNSGRFGAGIFIAAGTETQRRNITIENTHIGGNRTAKDCSGGGIYAGYYNTLNLLDCVLERNHSEDNGGGIYNAFDAKLNLSGGSIQENTAQRGGGIFAYKSTVVAQKTQITRNNATGPLTDEGTGGGIYISDLARLFANNVSFADNYAIRGFFWTLDPVAQSGPSLIHQQNMVGCRYTSPFSNSYNNYDVNFVSDTPGAYVTAEYFKDDLTSPFARSQRFLAPVGQQLDEALVKLALGENWLNLHRPSGYQAGTIAGGYPTVQEDNTVVAVLYLPEEPEKPRPPQKPEPIPSRPGNSGGGSMTPGDPFQKPEPDHIVIDENGVPLGNLHLGNSNPFTGNGGMTVQAAGLLLILAAALAGISFKR